MFCGLGAAEKDGGVGDLSRVEGWEVYMDVGERCGSEVRCMLGV